MGHRSHPQKPQSLLSGHALPGFSCHLSGLGERQKRGAYRPDSDPGGEDASRPCGDADPFALFGL